MKIVIDKNRNFIDELFILDYTKQVNFAQAS